jgi:hypothetical protein
METLHERQRQGGGRKGDSLGGRAVKGQTGRGTGRRQEQGAGQ